MSRGKQPCRFHMFHARSMDLSVLPPVCMDTLQGTCAVRGLTRATSRVPIASKTGRAFGCKELTSARMPCKATPAVHPCDDDA